MIPVIEEEDGQWSISINGERLGKFKNRQTARIAADRWVNQAFRKGWAAVIETQRKRLSMTHDAL